MISSEKVKPLSAFLLCFAQRGQEETSAAANGWKCVCCWAPALLWLGRAWGCCDLLWQCIKPPEVVRFFVVWFQEKKKFFYPILIIIALLMLSQFKKKMAWSVGYYGQKTFWNQGPCASEAIMWDIFIPPLQCFSFSQSCKQEVNQTETLT